MTVTTTYVTPKQFSWSFSKLNNFNTCPKQYYHVDVLKDIVKKKNETLEWGSAVHDALAKYVKNDTPLPPGMSDFQEIADRVKNAKGTIYVEQKYALDINIAPCDWMSRKTWYRGIADVLIVNNNVALAIDYKLGKIVEDSQQLALMAACVFAYYPQVEKVRTEYWWLKEDAKSTASFTKADMPAVWNQVLPMVKALEHAHNTTTFPAKPGGLCKKWCPVKSCPHNGGG